MTLNHTLNFLEQLTYQQLKQSKALVILIFMVALLGLSSNALASDTVIPINNAIVQGKIYYQQCIACHGEKAQGNDELKAPSLVGQSNKYLYRQLTHFNKNIRGSHTKDIEGQKMSAITRSAGFTKKIEALSMYIATLPESHPVTKLLNEGNLKKGSSYYQGKCGACHGGKAQGNESFSAPKLSGLSKGYLLLQMENFSTGIRGTHQDDKYGRQMAIMAKTTSGKELLDIINYITYVSYQAQVGIK